MSAGEPRRVGFLGPEGSFTAEAARIAAPEATREPYTTIGEVLDAVRRGQASLGVVPLENSIEGSVNVTLDELAFGPPGARIRGEINLPIAMHLMAPAGTDLDDVEVVRSHPQAFAQCRRWLERHLPHAQLEAETSTAEAARLVAEAGDGAAAIGPALAGERFGLAIVRPDVHDFAGNTTRFAVVGERMHEATGADKTSLVVFFGEDRPGLLLRILEDFALRGINLTKIESRPTKQQLGEYCIFFDCSGHVTDARLAAALRSVHRHVAELRVLGSYPRADEISEEPIATETESAYAEAREWYARLLDDVDRPRG